jgi:phosphoglycolate phosphatase-like HAD superfamily hydrolase
MRPCLILVMLLACGGCAATASAPDPSASPSTLASWNDTAATSAITAFVAKTTTPGSRDFVPPAERVAVFDNDGTLWAEQPAYVQAMFLVDRVKVLAPQHPQWKTEEPFASLLRGDLKAALAGGEPALAKLVGATHSGVTTDEFDRIVRDWLATARHPTTGRPYTQMVYQPMLELLEYLRANGYRTYIASGGGVDFMRAFAETVYGIPPEQVIGSTLGLKLETRDGKPAIVKTPEIDFIDDKEGKPIGIHRHIGRRPVMTFGNSDGDLAMLQWTAAGPGPRFCLIVHHTDAQREWAYDRTSHVGRLDKALDEARARGWTVVSMKDDWKRVYPPAPAGEP